jgi:hypothetical protein
VGTTEEEEQQQQEMPSFTAISWFTGSFLHLHL